MAAIMHEHGQAPDTRVRALRAKIEQAQGRRLDAPVLPVHPLIAPLLPGGGLRLGSAYSITGSTALLMALMVEPSRTGSWCAAIGIPGFGVEAAEQLGIDLARLVLIPDPGERWLAVAATVAEVMPIVAVRPPGRVGDAEMSRLGARLRDRGAVLLVQGPWPQAEAVLSIRQSTWAGVGVGHGYLAEREVTVTSASRRHPAPRTVRMLLPGPDGGLAPAASRHVAEHAAEHAAEHIDERVDVPAMRAVG